MEKSNNRNIDVFKSIRELFLAPEKIYAKYKAANFSKIYFIILIILGFLSGMAEYIFQDEEAVGNIVKSSQGNEMLNEVMSTGKSLGGALETGMLAILVVIIKLFFVAFVYYLIIKILKQKVDYKKALGISSLAIAVYTFGSIPVSILNGVFNHLFTSLSSGYAGIFLSDLNPFYLWSLFLMYVGIKTCFDMKKNKALTAVSMFWVLKLITGLIWYGLRG